MFVVVVGALVRTRKSSVCTHGHASSLGAIYPPYIYIYMHTHAICIYSSKHICICSSVHICICSSIHICIYSSIHICIYSYSGTISVSILYISLTSPLVPQLVHTHILAITNTDTDNPTPSPPTSHLSPLTSAVLCCAVLCCAVLCYNTLTPLERKRERKRERGREREEVHRTCPSPVQSSQVKSSQTSNPQAPPQGNTKSARVHTLGLFLLEIGKGGEGRGSNGTALHCTKLN